MTGPWAAGLAAIDAVFAAPVVYTGAGLAGATIAAVRSEIPADEFAGFNGKKRRTSFEIAKTLLPALPSKADTIVDLGITWRVIDINDRSDIGRWQLWVER